MGRQAVFCIILCFTVLAVTCSGSSSWARWSRQASENTPPPEGGCVLPEPPEFASYNSSGCQMNKKSTVCNNVPGTTVPESWLLRFKCNEGYYPNEGESSLLVSCVAGNWTPSIPVCRTCGKNFNSVNLTGLGERESVFPWFVGIYIHNEYKNNALEQICGGTLISPHTVLTAAHCVISVDNKQVLTPSQLNVALGKRFREWTHDEPGALRASVREIAVSPRYSGPDTLYAHDVALLDIIFNETINSNMMPACVDWKRESTVTPGQLGTYTGWGLTENGRNSDTLNEMQLPYLDARRCLSNAPPEAQRLVTPDKFCSVTTSAATIYEGYAGGGLTFERNGTHYVQGVFSIQLRGDHSVVTFTNLSNAEVLKWLEDTKRSFESQHIET